MLELGFKKGGGEGDLVKESNRGGDHHLIYQVHIKSSRLEEFRGIRMRGFGHGYSIASMKYRLFISCIDMYL